MKKDFYLNNIAPVFNFLGWQATTQTIPWPPQDESPGTVEITRVENKAGETVDALVVAKLCEALGAAVETPPVAEAAGSEGAQIITMAPDADDPGPEGTEEDGPFELDYESLTDTDREYLKKYAKLQITGTLKNTREVIKGVFKASGWQYTGNFYGDGSFTFGVVRNSNGRIVDPWIVKTCLEEMGVLESVDLDEDDTRALRDAVKRASMKSVGPLDEVSEGGGPHPPGTPFDFPPLRVSPPPGAPLQMIAPSLVPPGAPMMWSQTTYQMQAGSTPALDHVIMADGMVQIKIALGAGNLIFIICSAAQAKKICADSARNLDGLKGYWGPETQQEAETEQEDQSGKED